MIIVTNLVHGLPLTHHLRSLAHHMDSCTKLTVALHLRLQLPSPTQLIVLVTNDWSEARVDPLAALLIQRGGQTGKYQAVVSRAMQTRQSRNQRQSNGSGQAADREDYQ